MLRAKVKHLMVSFFAIFIGSPLPIFGTLMHQNAYAAVLNHCDHSLLGEDAVLEQLIALENRVEDLIVQLTALKAYNSDDGKIGAQLYRIQNRINEFIENADSTMSRQIFEKQSQIIYRQLDDVQDHINLLIQRNSNTSWAAVIENPRLMKPDHFYQIDSLDNHLKQVVFAEDVVKEIFWSEQPLMQKASTLIFRALMRGRSHATDKSGIVAFETDRTVFKIRIIGTAVGAIRLAGYFVGESFFIVTWSNEPSHSDHASTKLIETVKRIRDR